MAGLGSSGSSVRAIGALSNLSLAATAAAARPLSGTYLAANSSFPNQAFTAIARIAISSTREVNSAAIVSPLQKSIFQEVAAFVKHSAGTNLAPSSNPEPNLFL